MCATSGSEVTAGFGDVDHSGNLIQDLYLTHELLYYIAYDAGGAEETMSEGDKCFLRQPLN